MTHVGTHKMKLAMKFCLAVAALLLVGTLPAVAEDEAKLPAEQIEFFESKIRPILVEHCYECHSTGAEDIEGDLVLDSKWGWETGGDSGAAIVPGNLEESLVIDAVRYEENIVSAMPPQSKLPAAKIKLLERWVEMGAPDPRGKVELSDAPAREVFDLEARRGEYWCWEAVSDPDPPAVKDAAWPLVDLDRFVLGRLEAAGLRPASPAEKHVWLRRVYFDLIGLPPTPEQIDAFVSDESQRAYEKVVDQLLQSPHFGEKWARHWMDLVRYAETYGHEFDFPIPYPTEYRDYLIRAFNADVPYDQFVREHIAGDLLPQPRKHPTEDFNESIIGTGFWFLHEATHAPTDVLKNEADIIDNQLDVFGKAFLGLTVACARCHDHKFDAISTDDYYALSAYIQSSCRQSYPLDPGQRIAQAAEKIHDLGRQADQLVRVGAADGPSPADYYAAAEAAIRDAIENPDESEETAQLFDGFESGYENWTVSGDAFGDQPATKPTSPQKEFAGRVGSGFVTSFWGTDKRKGELVSQPLKIERPYIHLKVGGGKKNVGVELRIGNDVIHKAAGENRDDLIDRVWDVRPHIGKTATIRIFDEHSGGWGHVNLDQIVFSNRASADSHALPVPSEKLLQEYASKEHLNVETLARWVNVLSVAELKASEPSPAAVLALRITEPKRCKSISRRLASQREARESASDDRELFESFDAGRLPAGWSTSGIGFQVVGDQPVLNLANPRSRPGTIDSGYFGNKATGILRSPTFTISKPTIHVRTRAGANVMMRVVIDNYQMTTFHTLLFGGTILKGGSTDTKGQWQWKRFDGYLKNYIGHNAYLEFVDDGDQEIAIDEIWFSEGGSPPPPGDELVETFAAEEFSFQQAWPAAEQKIRAGKRSALVDWLLQHKLIGGDDLAPGVSPLQQQAQQIAASMPRPKFVLAMAEGTREEASVYIRGSHINLGKKVAPRNLVALGGNELTRLELADQIASADNPLVARVIVNRLWHHLFGRGIIASVDDFGPQGQPASHPQLLEHLASQFVQDGWSIKTAIRKLVLSQTYRQASVPHPSNDPAKIAAADPTNKLLHRMRVRRLPAESIRDAILATSGRLDKKQFGGSVATYRTPFMTGRGARGSGPLDGNGRRTIYLSVYRNFLNPFLLTFDMPNPFGPKGRRSNSNVPAQALTLMNDPFVIQQAKLWGKKLQAEQSDPQARIRAAVKVAHGVDATDSHLQQLLAFVDKQRGQGASEDQAWADLAHALLNMKSFYFLK